ncbi:MAG: cadmium-translocating P-type ATPase, partial [Oscillospiraceae bacterium]|nr:cadmium-translocating P-type ATPase [Oscillospiraceae bacterium]
MTRKQKKMLLRILVAATLMILVNVLSLPQAVSAAVYLAAYLVIGWDVLRKAWKGVLNRRPFDECFLMTVATLGAIALAVYEKSGDYNEAVAVMLFYQIGEFFQSYAVGKSRRNITELMDIRPDYANIEQDGGLVQVDPDEIAIGSIIVVQPGEKVPLDGVVVEGNSTLDTAALTGESIPRSCDAGDEIISGCINLTGLLHIRTTKEFGESTVSRILELVENASSRKSRSEEFISRFARVYTPAVVYSALALALLPPLLRLFLGLPGDWQTWVYRALTFLVISCPCALVISIPLSFFAGIGGASREGILIKGSNYLETLSQVKTVVFDKTGTLTKGVFEVSGVHHSPMENAELLELAAMAECASSHPISRSLQRAHGAEIDRSLVTDIEEISGHGVTGRVNGRYVAVGNTKLMQRLNVPWQPFRSAGTIVHVAVDGAYAGHIVISDVEKPNAAEAIRALHRVGVKRTVMLT